jgi:hypothetical protein
MGFQSETLKHSFLSLGSNLARPLLVTLLLVELLPAIVSVKMKRFSARHKTNGCEGRFSQPPILVACVCTEITDFVGLSSRWRGSRIPGQ